MSAAHRANFSSQQLVSLADGIPAYATVSDLDEAEVIQALALQVLEFRNAQRFITQLADECRSKGEEILTQREVIEVQGRELQRLGAVTKNKRR